MEQSQPDVATDALAAYQAGDHRRARTLAAPLAAAGSSEALRVLAATEPDRIIEWLAVGLLAALAALTYGFVL